MRPEDVMAALADYVDFGGRPGPRETVPPPPDGDITMVRKGLLRPEAERLFGRPASASERREGGILGHHPGLQRRRTAGHGRVCR